MQIFNILQEPKCGGEPEYGVWHLKILLDIQMKYKILEI
jgi:hypothetical protein